jgi:hypothetical protein
MRINVLDLTLLVFDGSPYRQQSPLHSKRLSEPTIETFEKKMRSDVVSGPRQVAWECGEQEMYDKASSDVALCLTGQVAGFFLSPFFHSFILSFRPGPLAVVRKAPCRPGSRANCSLLQLCSRRDAWASLHRLGQPDTSLARASL